MANAVLIDPANFLPGLLDQNTQFGPIRGIGNSIYMLLIDTNNSNESVVFKSTDGGATWALLSSLGSSAKSACVSFDGTKFWIFQQLDSFSGTSGTLTSFDGPTESFGIGFTVPVDVLDAEIYQSADGNVHLVSDAQSAFSRNTVLYTVFDGIAFSGSAALFDITTISLTAEMINQVLFGDLDDNVHICNVYDSIGDPGSFRIYHWVASSTGTILLNAQLAKGPFAIGSGQHTIGKGCVTSNQTIILPYLFGSPANQQALVGSPPLTSPTWGDATIDAATFPSFQPVAAKAITAGSLSYIFYGLGTQVRVVTVTGSSLSGPEIIYDASVTPPPAPLTPDSDVEGPTAVFYTPTQLAIGFNLSPPLIGISPGFFLPFPISSPIVLPPTPSGGGASPFSPSVSPFAPAAEYNKPNAFTHCLCQKYVDWGCIDWDVLACTAPPDYTVMGFSEDEDEMFDAGAPYQYGSLVSGTRFYKSVIIPCPVAVAGDVVALNFTVPVGYDSVITGIVASYLGTGFREGSGDLVFRIKLNRVFAKDFGNVVTSLGTLQTPYPTQILAGSLSDIKLLVSAPNGSGSVLPGTPIAATLFGWWYPMQESARWQKMRRAA